jgi:hypothetical protein
MALIKDQRSVPVALILVAAALFGLRIALAVFGAGSP